MLHHPWSVTIISSLNDHFYRGKILTLALKLFPINAIIVIRFYRCRVIILCINLPKYIYREMLCVHHTLNILNHIIWKLFLLSAGILLLK